MQYLDDAALAARLDRTALIEALDQAFRSPCSVPPREQYQVPAAAAGASGGTLLLMPAWRAGGSMGVKLVTVFPDNGREGLPAVAASYLLFDAANGRPLALLDGGELTKRRTAAASALASRHLSSPASSRLLMVGTGQLAAHLIESHALVRPIREVRIWGRRPERARALAEALARGRPPGATWSVQCADDLEASVRWADIVSCATLAREPLVQGAWLAPGQHLDLVGAFTPEMREADDEAMARAELYVDTREGVLKESGEITGAIARGVIRESAIRAELGELASGRFRRSAPQAITVFKSVGTALEDLAAAELALARPAGPPRP